MRFRATVQSVLTFYRALFHFILRVLRPRPPLGLIQTIEKLQKKCIVKFSEAAMHIICNQEEGGIQVWSCVTLNSNYSSSTRDQEDPCRYSLRRLSHSLSLQ
jgi:HUS1 checkpoint protein